MPWKPNQWIAAALGLSVQPLGMLYVLRIKWAIVYTVLAFLVMIVELGLLKHNFEILNNNPLYWILMIGCSVHAFLIAKSTNLIENRPWYSRWYGLVFIALGSLLLVLLFRSYMYEPYRTSSSSMYPTIKSGSYLIVEKHGYGHYGSFGITIQKSSSSKIINKGDIIIFQFPPDPSIFFVKRVIGLPGDLIQYKNKELNINGVAVDTEKIFNLDGYEIFREVVGEKSYKIAHTMINSVDAYEYRVPKDCLFVMGDNRDHSIDSRFWGTVPISHLVGKVKYILTSTKENKVVRVNQ